MNHIPNRHPVLSPLLDVCTDLYRSGWAENHAGNVSIRLTDEELSTFDLSESASPLALSEPFEELAGESFLVTAAGSPFRLLAGDPERYCGIVTVSADGKSLDRRWGYRDNGRPTSELPAHLRSHIARSRVDPQTKVVLHCHPTHLIAMTHVHELDEIAFTRSLWGTNSESILAIPTGVGLLPWMVCGTDAIGIESAAKFHDHNVVVWAQHGVLVAGTSLQHVIGTVQSVEKSAATWLAVKDSNPHSIQLDQLRALATYFEIVPPEQFLS